MNDAQADYYTIEEVANALGVSIDTVRRRIKTGQLQAVKREATDIPGHGERWYIPKSALAPSVVVPVITTREEFDEATFRGEMERTFQQILDKRIRLMEERIGERIGNIEKTVAALPAGDSDTFNDISAELDKVRAELNGIKELLTPEVEIESPRYREHAWQFWRPKKPDAIEL